MIYSNTLVIYDEKLVRIILDNWNPKISKIRYLALKRTFGKIVKFGK